MHTHIYTHTYKHMYRHIYFKIVLLHTCVRYRHGPWICTYMHIYMYIPKIQVYVYNYAQIPKMNRLSNRKSVKPLSRVFQALFTCNARELRVHRRWVMVLTYDGRLQHLLRVGNRLARYWVASLLLYIIFTFVYGCVCVQLFVCVCVCMCACVYTFTRIHACTQTCTYC